ncbi:hypothetical protein RB195_008698 [Necator americanus]|uniref:Uncharacterized protein n=1 Tax=Necator americanus TaxID=51031 RepID=A0ABR1CPY6_NECAM
MARQDLVRIEKMDDRRVHNKINTAHVSRRNLLSTNDECAVTHLSYIATFALGLLQSNHVKSDALWRSEKGMQTAVNLSSGLLLARLPIPRSRNVGCVELLFSLGDPVGGRTSAARRNSTPRVISTPLRVNFSYRVIYWSDVVPTVPCYFVQGFRHQGIEVFYSDMDSTTNSKHTVCKSE